MLRHYLIMTCRDVLRQPVSAVMGILTLSLGLIAVIAAYAIVKYWSSSDAFFAKSARTYVVTATLGFAESGLRTGTMPQTNADYARYLRTEQPQLEAVARSALAIDVTISTGDRGLRLNRLIVDPEFADIFELAYVQGDPRRALQAPRSVVLVEEIAANLFGDQDPMGRTLTLAGQIDVTVTGVVQRVPEPSHLRDVDFFATWDIREAIAQLRQPDAPANPPENWLNDYSMTTYALLPADGSYTGARLNDDLAAFPSRRLSAEELSRFQFEVRAVPLAGLAAATLNWALFGPASEYLSITAIVFLLGALILLVAIVNYANLATARALKRARDVGLRRVVGASQRQIVGQYLFEAGLLVLIALAVSVVGIHLLAPAIHAWIGIDLGVGDILGGSEFFVFSAAMLVLVTVMAGAYPAFVLSRVRPIDALRAGRLRAAPKAVSRLLVGTQFLTAGFLLIMVAVMHLQTAELRRSGLWHDGDPLLLIDNAVRLSGVSEETLRRELSALPQVRAVTSAVPPPWAPGISVNSIARTPELGAPGSSIFMNIVGPDFFEVLGIPVLAGRVFTQELDEPFIFRGFMDLLAGGSELPIVLDRASVVQLDFDSPEAAAGALVYRWVTADQPPQALRVVGVVENRPLHLSGFGVTANMFYLARELEFVIARISSEDVSGALAGIDEIWDRLSPTMPRSRRFLDEVFDESYEAFSQMSWLFLVLSAMAVFISVVGLLGMAIHAANDRRHEIGVRKTVGASVREIVTMLLGDFCRPVIVASLLAWPIAYIAANAYLDAFMYRIALTPTPFVLSLIVTLVVAAAAVAHQAVKAARVRPSEVLNAE